MLKEITKNLSYVFFHLNNKENINNSSTKSLSSVKDNPSSKSVKIDG